LTIVDVHEHVFSPDRERYPFAPLQGRIAPFVAERPVAAEAMLDEMDAAGVARAVLVQASTAYGYDNAYAADSAAAHPQRFAAVCCIDVRAPDAAERLRYWIRERGMNGVRLINPGGAAAEDAGWVDDPATFPAWEAAAGLRVPVALQLKSGGLVRLPALLARFPDVRVIVDHCGSGRWRASRTFS
jgi:predicted TIM-barrel fold metal-dependent hydrolase